MFDSRLIETAIGLVFVFLMTSLLCSVINELLATIMAWRAKMLKKGIARLLGPQTTITPPSVSGQPAPTNVPLLESFEGHGLIASVARGKNLPSYIPARNFALTVISILGVDVSSTAQDITDRISKISGNDALKGVLSTFVASGAVDIQKLQGDVENWFNDAMDRVSGSYKRWTQLFTLVIGLIVAGTLNINSIDIVGVLWTDDAVRAFAADRAQEYVREHPEVPGAIGQDATGAEFTKAIKGFTGQLDALKLPIGWQGWTMAEIGGMTAGQYFLLGAGWLITALAVSLGAQFWFQILGDLLKLRGTGPKPK